MTSKSVSHNQHEDKDLADAARKSVEQIWQAGLGAFARARDEGGDMFAKLVDEGAAVQKRTRQFAEDRLEGVNATISKMADSLGKQASGSLEKLESVFEERVTRSLQRLGVPTRDDIKGLSKQLTQLQETLDAMSARKRPSTTTRQAVEAPKQRSSAKPAKPTVARTASKANGKRSSTTSARA